MQRTFGSWAQDIKTSRVVPEPEALRGPAIESRQEQPVEVEPVASPTKVTAPAHSDASPSKTPSPAVGQDGVVMSVPSTAGAGVVRPPELPASQQTNAASASTPSARPVEPKSDKQAPGSPPTKPVNDPKLLEEFQRHLKKGR